MNLWPPILLLLAVVGIGYGALTMVTALVRDHALTFVVGGMTVVISAFLGVLIFAGVFS